MDVDRSVPQGGFDEALNRVRFCLDQLEQHPFIKGMDWQTEICQRLTVEEMIGALVCAEQALKETAIDEEDPDV